MTLYPEHINRIQKLLVKQAANPQVKRRAESVDTVAASLGTSGGQPKPDAATAERAGFEAIVHRNLPDARSDFGKAYSASPTYHNVDEIYHLVLTDDRIKQYAKASKDQQSALLRTVAQEILKDYSWGLPANLNEDFRQLAA